MKKRTNVKKERGGVDLGAAETSWTGVEATVGSMAGFRLWWPSRHWGVPSFISWCYKVTGLHLPLISLRGGL